MPYIKKSDKEYLVGVGKKGDSITQPIVIPRTAGELNYIITLFLTNYLTEHGRSYQTINDIIGALEGAKLEFVRRVVNPYEDEKCKINGDVYE